MKMNNNSKEKDTSNSEYENESAHFNFEHLNIVDDGNTEWE